MHTVVSRLEGATTSNPVIKSIYHRPKALTITHIGFVTNLVQGLTPEIAHRWNISTMWRHVCRKHTVFVPLQAELLLLFCSAALTHPPRRRPRIVLQSRVRFRPRCVCYCWGSSHSEPTRDAEHRCGKKTANKNQHEHTRSSHTNTSSVRCCCVF